MDVDKFFAQLWQEYINITPQALKINELFVSLGETVVNDHIALRTFDLSPISIKQLSPFIEQLGYHQLDSYEFPQKHLYAQSYLANDGNDPRIFISELKTHSLSAANQQRVQALCEQIDIDVVHGPEIFTKGRLWSMPSWSDYQALIAESEYAAWLSVMGLRANHFTISVNHLTKYNSLEKVNQLLLDSGFQLNDSGGLIKGTPEQLLEQSSTLADKIVMTFSDGGQQVVTSCYYEFAKRYKQTDNTLFQGFISGSADKIFESTNR